MALSFHKPQHRFLSNYLLLHHHFSSSSNDESGPPQDNAQTPPTPQLAPKDILQSFKKNLPHFPKPQNQPSDSSTPVSLEEYYQRNANSKRLSGISPTTLSNPLAAITESLRSMDRKNPRERNVLRGGIRNVGERSNVIGGTQGLPAARSAKEMNDHKERMATSLLRQYSHKQLGEKLRSLRPAEKTGEKGWFSLQELSERLNKLKKLEMDNQSTVVGVNGLPIRNLYYTVKEEEEEKDRITSRKCSKA